MCVVVRVSFEVGIKMAMSLDGVVHMAVLLLVLLNLVSMLMMIMGW